MNQNIINPFIIDFDEETNEGEAASLNMSNTKYKWKRRLPASKFGAIIKSVGDHRKSLALADEIIHKKCECYVFITLTDIAILRSFN